MRNQQKKLNSIKITKTKEIEKQVKKKKKFNKEDYFLNLLLILFDPIANRANSNIHNGLAVG